MWFAAAHGQLDTMKLLVKYSGDINIADNLHQTPLYLACVNNEYKCVNYLINECKEMECNVNVQASNTGTSALGAACIMGHLKCVKILCNCSSVKILDLRTPDTDISIVEHTIIGSLGDSKIVKHLYQALIKRYNITNFNGIIKHKIMSIESINELLEGLASVKLKVGSMYKFLTQILEEAVKPRNFEKLLVLIDYENNGIKKQRIDTDYFKMNKNYQIAQIFVQYLSNVNGNNNGTINFWNKLINNLIMNKEPINDCLLLIANTIDQNQLIESLKKCISDCIDKHKNERDYAYFKECLLHSSIWALKCNDHDRDDNKDDNKDDTNNNMLMLFDKINDSVINPLLFKQELYISECMKNEINNEMIDWKELCEYREYNIGRFGVIRQDCTINAQNDKDIMIIEKPQDKLGFMQLFSLMSKASSSGEEGLTRKPCEYEMKEIVNNVEENWNGCDEYNFNGYLTQLLLIANNVNYEFQNDCKRYFTNKEMSLVSCTFKQGTIKTKERSIKKTITDYL